METDRSLNLIRIVERLETEEVVAWQDVYDHIEEFPNWVTILERIQNPGLNKVGRFHESPGFVTMDKHIAEQIHRFLKPYALLISLKSTPEECADRLDEWLGEESLAFCKRSAEDSSLEISLAAKLVLPAVEALAASKAGVRKNWFQKLFNLAKKSG